MIFRPCCGLSRLRGAFRGRSFQSFEVVLVPCLATAEGQGCDVNLEGRNAFEKRRLVALAYKSGVLG